MRASALDTSVALPLLVQTHEAHDEVVQWWAGQPIALAGHAVAETFSVLTRLPGDLRMSPDGAARLMEARFAEPYLLGSRTMRKLPSILGRRGVAGGAVYDALVALAAVEHDVPLVTRDARARSTYELAGATVVVL